MLPVCCGGSAVNLLRSVCMFIWPGRVKRIIGARVSAVYHAISPLSGMERAPHLTRQGRRALLQRGYVAAALRPRPPNAARSRSIWGLLRRLAGLMVFLLSY